MCESKPVNMRVNYCIQAVSSGETVLVGGSDLDIFPVGCVRGFFSEVPPKCVPADGRMLAIEEYTELYAVIGHSYCPRVLQKRKPLSFTQKMLERLGVSIRPEFETEPNPEWQEGFFKVPDLRGMFL